MTYLLRRSKFAILTAALALGGLVAAATPAAHAGSGPSIVAYYSAGAGVSVLGGGFTPPTYLNPHPEVRVEVLTADLRRTLGTAYLPVNEFGQIDGDVSGNDMLCLQSYSGQVYVAADGQPGPTAWAQTYASFPRTCSVHL
jgi:hypothetical protein